MRGSVKLRSGNIVRRICGLGAGVILACAFAGAAFAQERLSMPFTCAVSGGRLFVEPSQERSYAILGRRDQEAFDICSSHNPSQCRTWQLHRFDVECDGGRVPWLSVFAAAPGMRRRQLWVENDRLHLRFGADRFNERRRPCFGAPWSGRGERLEGFPAWGDCDSNYQPRDRSVTVLPAGFAPLMQLGARIIAVPPPFRLEEPPRQVGPEMRPQVLSRQEMGAPLPPFRLEEPPRQVGPEMRPQVLSRQEMGTGEKAPSPFRSGGEERPPFSTSNNNAAPAKTPPPVQRSPEATAADGQPRTSVAPRVLAESQTASGAKSETQKLAEAPKPVEAQKPVEAAKSSEPSKTQKSVETTKVIETPKPVEATKSAEPSKPDSDWRASTRTDDKTNHPVSTPLAREDVGLDRGVVGTLIASIHRHAPILAPIFAALLVLPLAFVAWRLLRPAPAGDAAETVSDQSDKEPVWPNLGGITAPAPARSAVEDLMRNADDFYVHVKALVGQMPDTNPLRDVVADELAAIDATLRAPDLASAYAAEDWAKLRQCAVQALTDLERIRRIVQGAKETAAAAAPSAPVPPAERLGHPVPTTREEALAVLGVNAEASEKVIKKIVDAMRQTWHPDLARDDADRRAREERMKQINIAWDILRPKRQAA